MIPSLSYGFLHQGKVVESVIDANTVFVDDVETRSDASTVTFPRKIIKNIFL